MPHSSDICSDVQPAMPVTLKTLRLSLVILIALSFLCFRANMTSAVMKLSTSPDLLDSADFASARWHVISGWRRAQ